MYTAKHARLYKHKVHDGQAYIFYMDIRSTGKGYEEFIQQGMEEEGALNLRGRLSRVFRDGEKVVIWGADWYPESKTVEFIALINIRPPQGNRRMEIEDPKLQAKIETIVRQLLEVEST
jgi:heterodisulfide reductase subunit A-like polyferredoxin